MSDGQNNKNETGILAEDKDDIQPYIEDDESKDAHIRIQLFLERLKCVPDSPFLLNISQLHKIAINIRTKMQDALQLLPKFEFIIFPDTPFYKIDNDFPRYQGNVEQLNKDLAESKIIADEYHDLENSLRGQKDFVKKTADFHQTPAWNRLMNLDDKIHAGLKSLMGCLKRDLANLEHAFEDFDLIKSKRVANNPIQTHLTR